MSVTVYGIPSCGTVRKARNWLNDHDIPHEFVDFRSTPVPSERVAAWVEALGARAMRNTSGAAYRALGPEKAGWSDEEWTQAFQRDPMLIRRPIVERDGVPVAVGFRADRYAELFSR